MSFLITGFGRSGTMFLSRLMNRSELWSVRHEPRGAADEDAYWRGDRAPPNGTYEPFLQEYYGEVNSRLRFWAWQLPVTRRGVLLRDPRDIVVSIANRHPLRVVPLVRQLHYFWHEFHEWVASRGVVPIQFDRLTTEPEYTMDILLRFGIADVDVQVSMLRPVNATRERRFKSFEELPPEVTAAYEGLRWRYVR